MKKAYSDLDRLRQESKVCPSSVIAVKSKFPNFGEASIIRHLMANDNNVEETINHIDKFLLWRQSNFPMTSCTYSSDLAAKCYINGMDFQGHPLLIFSPGLNDPKTRNLDELVRWIVYLIEIGIKRLPKNLHQITFLINRESDEPIEADYDLFTTLGQLCLAYYPYRIYRLYVFPTSMMFRGYWNTLRHILPSKAPKPMRPIASLEALREVIPDEYIPRNLGGSCDYKFKMEDFPSPFVNGYITNLEELESAGGVGVLRSEAGEIVEEEEYLQDIYEDNSMTNNANNPNAINQPSMSIYKLNALSHGATGNLGSLKASIDSVDAVDSRRKSPKLPTPEKIIYSESIINYEYADFNSVKSNRNSARINAAITGIEADANVPIVNNDNNTIKSNRNSARINVAIDV